MMTDPTSVNGLFEKLNEVDSGFSGRLQSSEIDIVKTTNLLGATTCSATSDLEFPTSLVKSRTWFTVSTRDIPQAWTVWRKEV
jgi:hypothetical protein